MSPNSYRSEAEDHLLSLLQMVNEWLRFAETKNAGLLALGGLSVTAVLGFAAQVDHFRWWDGLLLLVGCLFWLATLLLTASSFLPKTDLLNVTSRLSSTPSESDNLYFYGHLAKLDAEGLLTALELSSSPESPRYRFEKHLADQVIANSRITNDKLRAFEFAMRCWAVGLAFATVAVVAVIWG